MPRPNYENENVVNSSSKPQFKHKIGGKFPITSFELSNNKQHSLLPSKTTGNLITRNEKPK